MEGFFCPKKAGRFSRHSNLNAPIKQNLASTHIPSVLEPRHLYSTDQKRPYDVTFVPWAVARQLLWDVTVVDSLVLSRISAGLVDSPRWAAAKAKDQKSDIYKDSNNDGYNFQPIALTFRVLPSRALRCL